MHNPRSDSLLECFIVSGACRSPPAVDAAVGGPGEPGVQEVNAAQRVGAPGGLQQSRVIMQTQTLPEPVDGVDGHDDTLQTQTDQHHNYYYQHINKSSFNALRNISDNNNKMQF